LTKIVNTLYDATSVVKMQARTPGIRLLSNGRKLFNFKLMIYSTEIEKFPKAKQCLECHSCQDENDFEWKIARVKNGFFIA